MLSKKLFQWVKPSGWVFIGIKNDPSQCSGKLSFSWGCFFFFFPFLKPNVCKSRTELIPKVQRSRAWASPEGGKVIPALEWSGIGQGWMGGVKAQPQVMETSTRGSPGGLGWIWGTSSSPRECPRAPGWDCSGLDDPCGAPPAQGALGFHQSRKTEGIFSLVQGFAVRKTQMVPKNVCSQNRGMEGHVWRWGERAGSHQNLGIIPTALVLLWC